MTSPVFVFFFFFFLNDPAPPEISPLSLHAALPISRPGRRSGRPSAGPADRRHSGPPRSEEHTSELQSRLHLVCRLLLGTKKTKGCAGARPCESRGAPHQPPGPPAG